MRHKLFYRDANTDCQRSVSILAYFGRDTDFAQTQSVHNKMTMRASPLPARSSAGEMEPERIYYEELEAARDQVETFWRDNFDGRTHMHHRSSQEFANEFFGYQWFSDAVIDYTQRHAKRLFAELLPVPEPENCIEPEGQVLGALIVARSNMAKSLRDFAKAEERVTIAQRAFMVAVAGAQVLDRSERYSRVAADCPAECCKRQRTAAPRLTSPPLPQQQQRAHP